MQPFPWESGSSTLRPTRAAQGRVTISPSILVPIQAKCATINQEGVLLAQTSCPVKQSQRSSRMLRGACNLFLAVCWEPRLPAHPVYQPKGQGTIIQPGMPLKKCFASEMTHK